MWHLEYLHCTTARQQIFSIFGLTVTPSGFVVTHSFRINVTQCCADLPLTFEEMPLTLMTFVTHFHPNRLRSSEILAPQHVYIGSLSWQALFAGARPQTKLVKITHFEKNCLASLHNLHNNKRSAKVDSSGPTSLSPQENQPWLYHMTLLKLSIHWR